MTSFVDIGNRALQSIGARSTIASLTEKSNEAIQVNIAIDPLRQQLLRMAPWNCATNFNSLALVCSAPGTSENPGVGQNVWTKGIPAPPWSYEYLYPADCLRPLWIVPQFTTGFSSGVPITTAVTGGAPQFWNGPPVRFKVSIDQISSVTGLPAIGGSDTRVILTNQEQAILCYIKDITAPDVMDPQFQEAWVSALAARLVFALTGDKSLANIKIQEANSYIQIARTGDANEGLTINDVTPDWIRVRGYDPVAFNQYGPAAFDWGNLLTLY